MRHVVIPHAVDAAAAAIRMVCAGVRSHVARHGASYSDLSDDRLLKPVSLRSEDQNREPQVYGRVKNLSFWDRLGHAHVIRCDNCLVTGC